MVFFSFCPLKDVPNFIPICMELIIFANTTMVQTPHHSLLLHILENKSRHSGLWRQQTCLAETWKLSLAGHLLYETRFCQISILSGKKCKGFPDRNKCLQCCSRNPSCASQNLKELQKKDFSYYTWQIDQSNRMRKKITGFSPSLLH